MPKVSIYFCDGCGGQCPPEDMILKTVVFRQGVGRGVTARTRVIAWLCPDCVIRDRHWNLPARSGTTRIHDIAAAALPARVSDALDPPSNPGTSEEEEAVQEDAEPDPGQAAPPDRPSGYVGGARL